MEDKTGSEKSEYKKYFFLLLLIPLSAYFYFGTNHLAKFETADEHYWIYSKTVQNNYWGRNDGRIHQYWEALLKGNWVMTRINDKPGITLAYVSGIGSWLKTNLDARIERGELSALSKADKAEKINLYFRLPILIFNGLFSLVLYFLLKKLLESDWIALLAAAFILLSPIILGISQIVNPDALLWEFNFAAILSFLIFLRDRSKKYAAWSGIFLGLSLLTKYSSVILIPFFLAALLAFLFENIGRWEKEAIAQRIKFYSLSYLLIIAAGLLIYAVILPDNLVEFRHFMKGSLGFKGMQWLFLSVFALDILILFDAYFLKSRILIWSARKFYDIEKYFKIFIFGALSLIFSIIIANAAIGNDWLRFFSIPFDAAPAGVFSKLSSQQIFFMQFLPLTFSLTPIVILGALYAWIKNAIKPSRFGWIIFVFSFFLVVFVAASMQQKLLLTIRYSIILYPLVMTIAAIGIYQFMQKLRAYEKLKYAFLGAIILISAFSAYAAKPFYFNYTNLLLPKNYLITDAWGYGGYEAAQYLNGFPSSENFRVWSDYNGFCVFFKGNCVANKLTMKNIRKNKTELPRFDYFVSSRRGSVLSRGLWNILPEEYQSRPIWKLIINGRAENFITIYENGIYRNQ